MNRLINTLKSTKIATKAYHVPAINQWNYNIFLNNNNNNNNNVIMYNNNNSQNNSRMNNIMFFSTEATTGENAKNPNIHGVGGPGTKRPGVRRKNHMKRMRMRFKKTKKHHKISQQQQKAARAKRLEKIRAKQQFFKDIGLTKKEFLG